VPAVLDDLKGVLGEVPVTFFEREILGDPLLIEANEIF
jgi:hypothetical protein